LDAFAGGAEVKLKIRSKGQRLLSNLKKGEVDVRITKLIEEFLPLLIGAELYFGLAAQQYVTNLKLPNQDQVVKLLLQTGYITGSLQTWKLSDQVIKTVSDRLARTGAIRSQLTYSASETPVSVTSLAKLYNWRLKRVPEQHRKQHVTNICAFFRRLSKKHDSTKIEAQIGRFFEYAAKSNHDYKLETFEKYLKGLK
jgi:DNA gyrase/topoisomerase IV subunit A